MVYNACQGNTSRISRSLSAEETEIQRRKVKILWQDIANFVKLWPSGQEFCPRTVLYMREPSVRSHRAEHYSIQGFSGFFKTGV